MLLSGQSPDGRLVEIVELRDHPWFVASQFHPELRSRPNRAHPLFRDLVKAAFLQSGIDQMELRPAELLEESPEK
jgi:CTP synthase